MNLRENYETSFENEVYWRTIKDGVLQKISMPCSGEGKYNEWLHIIMTAKQAGYSLEEIVALCDEGSISESKWAGFPEGNSITARKEMVSIAQENGYMMPKQERRPSSVLDSCNLTYNSNIKWFEYEKSEAINNARKLLKILFPDNEEKVCLCFPSYSNKRKKWEPSENIKFYHQDHLCKILENLLECENHGVFLNLNKVNENEFLEHKKINPYCGIKKEYVVNYQYYYIECDDLSIEEQKKKLETMDLPWLAIVHSGNKSLHVILRLDAETEQQFAERIKQIHNYCDTKGFKYDSAIKDIQRWDRFPCAIRDGKYQYIVAYNDHPCSFDDWQKRHVQEQTIKTVQEQEEKRINIFYQKKDGSYVVDHKKALDFFSSLGYHAVKDENGKMIQVKIDGHFIEKIDRKTIIAEIKRIIFERCTEEECSAFVKFAENLGETFFAMLEEIKIALHTDERDKVYLYFKNGILEITANNKRLLPYDILEGSYIWKNSFKTLMHNYVESDSAGEWSVFCSDIMSNDPAKIKSLKGIAGYYISRFKDPSLAKCVYLTDSKADFDGEENNGRSGKNLLLKGIEEVRKVGYIDGKDFSSNGRFMFSQYQDGQTVYIFNDIKRNFNIEIIYNKVTNDFEVEYKGKDIKTIPFDISPKIGITANFIVKNYTNPSTDGRLITCEFSNFYSNTYTPRMKFNHNFFLDWDESEWNKFYSFQVECIQEYLQNGIHNVKSDGFNLKAHLSTVNESVIEFNITHEPEYGIKIYYSEWLAEYKEWMDTNKKSNFACNFKSFAKSQKTFFEGGYIKAKDSKGCYYIITKENCKIFQNGVTMQDIAAMITG